MSIENQYVFLLKIKNWENEFFHVKKFIKLKRLFPRERFSQDL